MKIKMNGYSRAEEILLTAFIFSLSRFKTFFFNIHYYELSFADKVVEGQKERRSKLYPEQYSFTHS